MVTSMSEVEDPETPGSKNTAIAIIISSCVGGGSAILFFVAFVIICNKKNGSGKGKKAGDSPSQRNRKIQPSTSTSSTTHLTHTNGFKKVSFTEFWVPRGGGGEADTYQYVASLSCYFVWCQLSSFLEMQHLIVLDKVNVSGKAQKFISWLIYPVHYLVLQSSRPGDMFELAPVENEYVREYGDNTYFR